MKILTVSGPCLTGDCDCQLFNRAIVKKFPPRHEGCTCYVTETSLIETNAILEFMEETENKYASGRLGWDLLKDFLEEQKVA